MLTRKKKRSLGQQCNKCHYSFENTLVQMFIENEHALDSNMIPGAVGSLHWNPRSGKVDEGSNETPQCLICVITLLKIQKVARKPHSFNTVP